jgi:hypothetical protein
LLAKIAEQYHKVLRGISCRTGKSAPSETSSICRYATIIAKSAFAVSDGESRLRDRDDKKFYDSIPPLPGCFSVAKPFLWVGR